MAAVWVVSDPDQSPGLGPSWLQTFSWGSPRLHSELLRFGRKRIIRMGYK